MRSVHVLPNPSFLLVVVVVVSPGKQFSKGIKVPNVGNHLGERKMTRLLFYWLAAAETAQQRDKTTAANMLLCYICIKNGELLCFTRSTRPDV